MAKSSKKSSKLWESLQRALDDAEYTGEYDQSLRCCEKILKRNRQDVDGLKTKCFCLIQVPAGRATRRACVNVCRITHRATQPIQPHQLAQQAPPTTVACLSSVDRLRRMARSRTRCRSPPPSMACACGERLACISCLFTCTQQLPPPFAQLATFVALALHPSVSTSGCAAPRRNRSSAEPQASPLSVVGPSDAAP